MTFYSSAATHQDHDFENMESNGHTSALEKYEQESINHFGDVAIPAVAAALSLGDLGVIALFVGEGQATLPLVIQRLRGSYQLGAAAGASLVLIILGFALFALFDLGGRRAAA